MELTEATCVVTGARSMIGTATVRELLACGATVVAVDATEPADGTRMLAADVTTPEGRALVFETAPDATHLVTIGSSSDPCPVADVTPEYWDGMLGANAKSAFFLLQHFVPLLPAGGAVVNVASVAGKTSRSPEAAVYAASQAAVLSVTRAFANVFGPQQVRVNAICTGIVESPENSSYLREVAASRGTTEAEVAASRFAVVPMARAGTPEECARLIRSLLSDDAGFVTGQAVNVTGGFHNY